MNQTKPKIELAPLDMQEGALFQTKSHGYAEVVKYYNTFTVIISFKNTGNIRAISASKLRSGNVSDRSSPVSTLVGTSVKSSKHGNLTITEVNEDNIVTLTSEDGETVRMLLAKVRKLQDTVETLGMAKKSGNTKVSLADLAKKNRKPQSVKKAVDVMLTDYGA